MARGTTLGVDGSQLDTSRSEHIDGRIHTSPTSTDEHSEKCSSEPGLESTVKALIMTGNTGMLHKSRDCTKESKKPRVIGHERALVYHEESPGFGLQNGKGETLYNT